MFKLDGVELEFADSGIAAVAKQAIKLNTGARGLRTIIEDTMLDIMYHTPDDKTIAKVVVDEEAVISKQPKIIRVEVKQMPQKTEIQEVA